MPPLEEGNLWIRAVLPRTVTLQEAARMAPRLRTGDRLDRRKSGP